MLKDTIIPNVDPAKEAAGRNATPLVDRLARGLVIRTLRNITRGRLVMREADRTHAMGQCHPTAISAELRVHNSRFFRSLAFGGTLGAGDAYTRGDWSSDNLTALIRLMIANQEALGGLDGGRRWVRSAVARLRHYAASNTKAGSRRNVAAHYDLSNEFYALFLDPTMTYSCGIFENPKHSMQQASIAKLDRICRKLKLRPDHHVLEIGSGWGSFALHAAGRYGCRVTTTTISEAQFALARERIDAAGLRHRVTLLKRDYRDLKGKFDRLVSIEMIEAVGHRYYESFFRACGRLLEPGGLMALQAITMAERYFEHARRDVDFIKARVFPGSCIPSLGAMIGAAQCSSDLQPTHVEDFGPHYARTLREWRDAFMRGLPAVRNLGFDDAFIRLWEYYLCYCEAGFLERTIGVCQMLLTRPANREVPYLTSRDTALIGAPGA